MLVVVSLVLGLCVGSKARSGPCVGGESLSRGSWCGRNTPPVVLLGHVELGEAAAHALVSDFLHDLIGRLRPRSSSDIDLGPGLICAGVDDGLLRPNSGDWGKAVRKYASLY